MSDDITLQLENREILGKGINHLRRDGKVPGVIHDHGKDSVHVQASYIEMYKVYQRAGKHHPVDLTVDGKKYLALIKDASFEPRKNQLRHVVFNAIKQNEKVTAEIPVVFEGNPEAEKVGLMVLRQIEHVDVEAFPKNLPDEFSIDISGLTEIGDRLHVSDLPVPEGVVILTEAENPVAVVEEPRSHAAAEAEEAEAAEDAVAEGEEGEAASEGEATEQSEK